ncbi:MULTISPECIES: acetyl-CoA carboxylase biotin carboxyl carrier protein [Thermomonospora]|uniref:Biotin carboxyl carrier protein of acetyl-CoA carboxylase n=1 Tax=Thermomonospora cellulosilytica TaxID=1411118 RepID=A0A7W3N0Z1_9ACTN|nr:MULTISPECIES: acetyl-CoA carboxylase biotin carboxyl carrier protein [Thermomonospora]MBA9005528.1 acetyl-CoA carboxylase biotin carboxyl carrier protein [Thermomonospora cellulosilytica]
MTDDPVSGPEPLLDAVVRRAAQLEAATAAPVRRMKIQSDGMTVEIEWSVEGGGAPRPAAPPPAVREPAADEGAVAITAPAVGVFYRAPEPGAEPFVKVGDRVEPGQQVGILEAMKLMNPIEADQAGLVTEILVDNETPVEYGQPLMLLKVDPESAGGE